MTRWINWTDFMQPDELVLLKEKTGLFSLDLAAWVQEEREGHLAYTTQFDTVDLAVWRDERGQLAWASIHPRWIPEHQIDQLHELLKARGFTGTRRDDYTRYHIVVFQQGEQRLEVHATRAEPQTSARLEAVASVFVDDIFWKSKGWA